MSREEFLDWAERQPTRHEFDGFTPVAMVGGTNNHDAICNNLRAALISRLRGTGCRAGGPDAGLATIGDTVRYPDAFVTCTNIPGHERLVPGVIVVCEVLSPGTARIDRIDKLQEYAAVPSIRRYLLIESTSTALTSFARNTPDEPWTATVLRAEDTLSLPEIGIELPVAELYEDVDLSGPA